MTDSRFLALSRRRALLSALGFGVAIEFVGHTGLRRRRWRRWPGAS